MRNLLLGLRFFVLAVGYLPIPGAFDTGFRLVVHIFESGRVACPALFPILPEGGFRGVSGRAADRRAFGVFAFFPMNVSVVRTRALYRFLARRGALPPLEKRRSSLSLRAFLTVALSRKNLKNYLFTGTLLLSVAFLTPLKGLYLAFGCLSLVLALLTLTPLGENEGGGSGLGGLAGDDEEYTRIPRTPSEPTNEE